MTLTIEHHTRKVSASPSSNRKTQKSGTPAEYSKWLAKGYPYAKHFIQPKHLIRRLRAYEPTISNEPYYYVYRKYVPEDIKEFKFRNKYVSIDIPLEAHNQLDIIVDYYTEESRLKCSLKDKPSAHQLIQTPKNNLLEYTLKNMIKEKRPITYESYRDEIYNYPGIYICSGESVLFYKGVISVLYGENYDSSQLNIMDGAIGYGQRLMTALVLKCNYIGIDPNTETIDGCHQMIRDLSVSPMRQRAYPEGLPESPAINNVPARSQDIVFFSPPAFDAELYGTHEAQSIVLFPTYEVWLAKFLKPSFLILASKIRPGGYFVIQSITMKTNFSFLNQIPNLKFIGVIARKTYSNYYKLNYVFKAIA